MLAAYKPVPYKKAVSVVSVQELYEQDINLPVHIITRIERSFLYFCEKIESPWIIFYIIIDKFAIIHIM